MQPEETVAAGFSPSPSNVAIQNRHKHFCLYVWLDSTLYDLSCFKQTESLKEASFKKGGKSGKNSYTSTHRTGVTSWKLITSLGEVENIKYHYHANWWLETAVIFNFFTV